MSALDHGIERLRDDFPMSLRLVRELHEVLMRGVRGEHATPGEFRRSPNWIGGTSPSNAVFVPPPVDEMKDLMDDWESFMYVRSLPLLIQLAMVHYQFEVIHPFLDGNGRVGRLLLPMLLIERGRFPSHCCISRCSLSDTEIRTTTCCLRRANAVSGIPGSSSFSLASLNRRETQRSERFG